ncbi:DUF397 domain-containing protein [Thermomonospora cellulosilytica]|uniref:DUF397 domain-containing protein n=1 Tax=Thermomonospora cellulosilytica TaxID=1411118 RepID=A0A7W3MVG2_9ACTN|nr:DUF397 domain-containing protein [Thermomonospora cellulosilytica]MBA9002649.1 hypothetical protein [Thermomonospora cellulosilytica]
MNETHPTDWRKSSHSDSGTGAQCVEAGRLPGAVALRDTKNREAGYLTLTPAAFRSLLEQARRA